MIVPLSVDVGHTTLESTITAPAHAQGLVVFTQGSGSSRYCPRNRDVARILYEGGNATLLTDLLCPDEERTDMRTGRYRFHVELLTARLIHVLTRVQLAQGSAGLPVGLFGVRTGAAVALLAAARRPDLVQAVVSRGGRPDLAAPELSSVRAPTLFLVDEKEPHVLELNYSAAASLPAAHEVETIPVVDGHSAQSAESGAMAHIASRARGWFTQHLGSRECSTELAIGETLTSSPG